MGRWSGEGGFTTCRAHALFPILHHDSQCPEACLTRFELVRSLSFNQYIVDLHTQVMESAFEKLQRDLQRDAEQQAEKKAAEAAAAAGAVAKPGLQVIGSQSPFLLPFPSFSFFLVYLFGNLPCAQCFNLMQISVRSYQHCRLRPNSMFHYQKDC